LIYDAAEYDSYARHLLSSGEYANDAGERATRMPGYPLFLAAVHWAFGDGVLAVQLLQCLLGALAVVLLAWAASSFAAPAWAFAAGALGVVSYDLFAGSPRVLTEALFIFVFSLFWAIWFRPAARDGLWAVALGVLAGFSALLRPEAVLFAGAVGAMVLLEKPVKKGLLLAAVFGTAAALTYAPWVLRNHRVFGAWVPTTTKASYNAYIGLQLSQVRSGMIGDGWGFKPDDSLPEVERDRAYAEATREIYKKTSPATVLKTMAFNAAVLFYPFHPHYDPVFFFLIPFWLAGVWAAARKKEYWVLVLCLGLGMTAYLLFGSTVSRYRQPLTPLFLLLAAGGAQFFWQRWGADRGRRWFAAWGGVNLFFWAVSPWARELFLRGKEIFW